jgi:hypothetical protein
MQLIRLIKNSSCNVSVFVCFKDDTYLHLLKLAKIGAFFGTKFTKREKFFNKWYIRHEITSNQDTIAYSRSTFGERKDEKRIDYSGTGKELTNSTS